MNLSGADWVKLNQLLDEALSVDPARRLEWVDSLPPEHRGLSATLRDLLSRGGALETAEVLRDSPALAAPFEVKAGDVVGPYRLLREIGSGGMSTVWLAERTDGSPRRQIALKLPRVARADAALIERLNCERDILASLEHPNIARLYDAGADEAGRPFLAMEYVDGAPLDQYALQHALTIRQRLRLFLQAASAVSCAHTQLVVHRDLKPTNMLVRKDGEVRLLDFGIARLLSGADLDAPAVRAFTPRYAAPEQIAGEAANVATDIYSLGVILYELLTGRSPYPRRPPAAAAMVSEVVCLDIIPMADAVDARTARLLRGDLEAIVGKALQQDPRQRYQSVRELMADIERHLDHWPVLAHPSSLGYRTHKLLRRRALAVGLGAALALSLIAGLAASLWQTRIAVRERDRAVRMFEQADATNEFWTALFTESVRVDEKISMSELLERAERASEEVAQAAPLQYSMAVDAIASMYIANGLPGKAETLLKRAIERTGDEDGGLHRLQTLECKYASAISYRGAMAEAEAILSRVIASTQEADLKRYCLLKLSFIARDRNDAPEALRYAQQARDMDEQLRLPPNSGAALILGELGYAYGLNGEIEKADQHFQRATRLFWQLGREHSHSALTVANNWGVLSISRGDPRGALEHYERAMAIARKHSPDGVAPPYLLGNRGAALTLLGRYDEALGEFGAAHERAIAGGAKRDEIMAIASAAEAHLLRGEPDAARALLDSIANGPPVDLRGPAAMRVMSARARLLMQQSRFAEARELLTQAIDAFEQGGAMVGGRTRPLVMRSETLLALRRFDEALRDAERAVQIGRQTRGSAPASSFLGGALLAQARAQQALGDRTRALESVRDAIANLKGSVGDQHPDTQRAEELLKELSSVS